MPDRHEIVVWTRALSDPDARVSARLRGIDTTAANPCRGEPVIVRDVQSQAMMTYVNVQSISSGNGGWTTGSYLGMPLDRTTCESLFPADPARGRCSVTTGERRLVPDPVEPVRRTCCRVCTRGKACGDSCIARNLTCRVGAGCACNGDQTGFLVSTASLQLTEALREMGPVARTPTAYK